MCIISYFSCIFNLSARIYNLFTTSAAPFVLFTLFFTGTEFVGLHFHEDRILTDALDPLPRDDKALLAAEPHKTGLAADDERAYPAVAGIEFKIAGVPEAGAVAQIYNVLLSQLAGGRSFRHFMYRLSLCSAFASLLFYSAKRKYRTHAAPQSVS